mgnify:CR=1 FL=1
MTHLPHSDLSGDLSGTGPAPQRPRQETPHQETPHQSSALLHLGLAVLPVLAASALGQIATMPNLTPWYASLVKPSFNPPNWVFGPVWTILYVLMAYAFYRILRAPGGAPRRTTITVFLVQLALNAAWSWAFFGFRSPLAGMLVILPLLTSIVIAIRSFSPVDRTAALLLYPYAAWVSFATLLTISIWWLNG